MTRKEAINILDDYDVNFDGHTAEEIAEAFDMAFKALEQEPCGDVVSRQEAIEEFQMFREYDSNRNNKEWVDRIETVLNQLPPVNPQKWIPVSERLPNLDNFSGSRVWQKKVLITGYLSFNDAKELFVSEVFAEDVILNRVLDTVIVAWMPLPKPYEAESEEDEITFNNLCNSCSNIGCEFQSGIVRTKCAFYMPPRIEADKSKSEDKI